MEGAAPFLGRSVSQIGLSWAIRNPPVRMENRVLSGSVPAFGQRRGMISDASMAPPENSGFPTEIAMAIETDQGGSALPNSDPASIAVSLPGENSDACPSPLGWSQV